jgi:hypothetical protein
LGFMMSAAFLWKAHGPLCSSRRRRSPSERMPRSLPLAWMVVIPRRLADISCMICGMAAEGGTLGRAMPACMSWRAVARRRPSWPPGWRSAKSRGLKSRRCMTSMARASPSASMAVVEAVGESWWAQASRSMETSSTCVLAEASVESSEPVKLTRVTPMRGMAGKLEQLFGFAGVAESDENVAGGEDAEVAVKGFSGMQKVRGRTSGAEGGGNLTGDETGLADSSDDGAMTGADGFGEEFGDAVEGFAERAIETLGEEFERSGFDADEFSGVRNVVRHRTEKMVAVRQRIGDRG